MPDSDPFFTPYHLADHMELRGAHLVDSYCSGDGDIWAFHAEFDRCLLATKEGLRVLNTRSSWCLSTIPWLFVGPHLLDHLLNCICPTEDWYESQDPDD